MDAAVLIWIHSHGSPALDAAFIFSWALGVFRFCAAAVLLAVGGALPELLKALVARSGEELRGASGLTAREASSKVSRLGWLQST